MKGTDYRRLMKRFKSELMRNPFIPQLVCSYFFLLNSFFLAVPFEEMVVVEDPPSRSKTVSIADMITNIFENISPLQFLKLDQNSQQGTTQVDDWEHHCRLPFHATHTRILGISARDLSSYFVRVLFSNLIVFILDRFGTFIANCRRLIKWTVYSILQTYYHSEYVRSVIRDLFRRA